MKTKNRVSITPQQAAVILCSPPGENRWGFYQFPDMWRAPGGEIYLAINVGSDSEIGQHEPSVFFVSRDNGRSWQQCALEEIDQSPPIIEFSDGSQVAFGKTCYIYHVHAYAHTQPWQWWKIAEMKVEPLSDAIPCRYDNNEFAIFRYEDIPPQFTPIPTSWRASPDAPWESAFCTLDAPDLHLFALARAYWWDENRQRVAEEKLELMFRPFPWFGQVARLPDDTLVWAHYGVNPRSLELNRMHFCVHLFASTDRGRTWHQRGMVADDTELTTDGYSAQEHSLQLMPNGDLLCVMRTEMGDHAEDTRFLAAARSSDGGFTWSRPEQIAPFSVTPLLMNLPNGMVALAYGRPGVYVRASADSGYTWTHALPVVGPPETELINEDWWIVPYDWRSDNKISCGNLGEVVTGPDRFLLAYSDFRHRNAQGELCKAVKVQEFIVESDAD